MYSLTLSPSFPDIYHTSLSKLLDTKISIAGAFVLKNSLLASYLPVVKKAVKILFLLDAAINLLTGRPIFFANHPAKQFPKFPLGTQKFT